jgi:hypothetical protein
MRNAPKTWKTSSPFRHLTTGPAAARARGVDLLLQTDQIDLTGAKPVDGLEQLLQ